MRNNLFIISKNGWSYILASFFAIIVFALLDLELFSFIALLAIAFFIYVFRNPERELLFLEDKAVVSPSDGIVRSIDELDNNEFCYRVQIESDCFSPAMLRCPMYTEVEDFTIIRGARTAKGSKLFNDLNERAEIIFCDEHNNKIKVVHRLKKSMIPLELDLLAQHTYMQGTRYGYALNAITELYLPKNFRFDIKPNKNLRASESLIGYFS